MRSSLLLASSLALGAVALPPAVQRRDLVTEVVVETVTVTEYVTEDYFEPTTTSNDFSTSSATTWADEIAPTDPAQPPRLVSPPPYLRTTSRPVGTPVASRRPLQSSPKRVSSAAPIVPAPVRSTPLQSRPPLGQLAGSSRPAPKPVSSNTLPWPNPYRPSSIVRTTRPTSRVPITTPTARPVPPSSSPQVAPPVQPTRQPTQPPQPSQQPQRPSSTAIPPVVQPNPWPQQPPSSPVAPPVQPTPQPNPVASPPPVQASSSVRVPATQPAAPADQHTPGQSQAYLSSGPAYRAAILYHHNAARANHNAGELIWDTDCEANALIAAQRCNFEHYIPPGVRQGQNLFTVSGQAFNATAGITESWYKSELPPMMPYFGKMDVPDDVFHSVGHLTQMVWKGTQKVGCVSIDCGSRMVVGGQASTMNKYTVCNYSPPGNVMGRYALNVAPPASLQNLGGWAD